MASLGSAAAWLRAWSILLGAAACALGSVAPAWSQIRTGAITGTVTDPSGARMAAQPVDVTDPATGRLWHVATDAEGRFAVAPLPYGHYVVSVRPSQGFTMVQADAHVASNLPTVVDVTLSLAPFDDSQVVTAPFVDAAPLTTRSERRLNREMAVLPPQRATSLASLMSGVPGVARAHNALVHVRGVEDGVLFVVDGVPVTERYDLLHASAVDVEAIEAITLVTGNLPAEFGGRSGAMVSLDRTPDRRRFGAVNVGAGNLATADASARAGALLGPVHLAGSLSASSSDRFLDPVDEGNFNNHGTRYLVGVRGAWRASASTRITFGGAGARTSLDVPNDAEQQAAGQRQGQTLDDENLSLGWQRVASGRVVADAALFHRRYASHLQGGPFDVPLTAVSDRAHIRTGALGAVTLQHGRHLFKAGVDVSRIALDESFQFAITDEAMARERDVSEPALAFDVDYPFVFKGRRVGSYLAAYVQDEVAIGPHVRLDAGLRVERSSLPRAATQVSPRLGAAATIPRIGATARVSFNRLFMPPHVEHLLLANSDEARALSPFADDTTGGANVRPERVSAIEVGAAQPLGGRLTLDVAYWDRRFVDVSDPNVFFNTTIVFPNSVASGRAHGVDVSLTLRERRGVSGFVNYTHSRVENVGPITGGLFLTDEFLEIGPGTAFHPDHDQPHVASAGMRLRPGARWWVALDARHGGGGPIEVEDDDLADVVAGPAGDLIDVARGRMRPWTLLDMAASVEMARGRRGALALRADVQNVLGSRFAYTVGNPFEGTRFGHSRLFRVGIEWRWPD